jgi:hypothetical protein
MLFHPSADERLEAVAAQLDQWDGEADRIRSVALAVRQGTAPSEALLAAAEDARDGLTSLIDELDRALEAAPAGHESFAKLLRAQKRALALSESIGNSLDLLAECPAVPISEPASVGHPDALQAAE